MQPEGELSYLSMNIIYASTQPYAPNVMHQILRKQKPSRDLQRPEGKSTFDRRGHVSNPNNDYAFRIKPHY